MFCSICLRISFSQHCEETGERDIMGFKALCLGLLCALCASYIYITIPGNIEEYWKVIALFTVAKTCTFMVRLTFFILDIGMPC